MAGLAETLATLSQRRWTAEAPPGASSRLREVADFGADPGDLRMLLHAPDGLADGAALVVVLHGCTQTAEAYAEGTGWLALADRYGFAVLCPEQRRPNNMNLCFNWFQPSDTTRGQGEAASIRAMIGHAMATLPLDPRRVFVTGLSAGGAMANVMLATYPELFAAGAIIAGLPYGAASNVQQALGAMRGGGRRRSGEWGDKVREASAHPGPWPRISVWQGDQDTTVHSAVADEVVTQWVEVQDAQGPTVVPEAGGVVRRSQWLGPDGEVAVVLHSIAGMGHGAPLACSGPDACGRAGPYLLDVGVSSSVELARSWGLGDGPGRAAPEARPTEPAPPRAAPEARPTRPAPPRSAEPAAPSAARAPPHTARAATLDIGAVISKALRDAGLLK